MLPHFIKGLTELVKEVNKLSEDLLFLEFKHPWNQTKSRLYLIIADNLLILFLLHKNV